MPRILLLYYSQSGDAALVAQALAGSLAVPGIELVVERLRPKDDFPLPWRSIGRFFGILPECHLGPLPELQPPRFDPDEHFDLIVLVYQVWFLAPSLPVQSLLRSAVAKVFRETKVVTVSVSRNMWQSASETMKTMLKSAEARHIDNVVLTHQGPVWATFITTPRALLYGKKDGLWGLLPPAGIGAAELARVTRIGEAIASQKDKLDQRHAGPLLRGLGAVQISHRYLLPELVGFHYFRTWARILHALGRLSTGLRRAGVYVFVASLLVVIVVGIPLSFLVRLLLWPFIGRRIKAYAERLAEPSGL
jgi:hypothetical protein